MDTYMYMEDSQAPVFRTEAGFQERRHPDLLKPGSGTGIPKETGDPQL